MDDAGPLDDLLRDLEGSTHGGPRHAMLFDSIRRVVAADPEAAFDQMDRGPSSSISVLLMTLSGLGRALLPTVLDRLSSTRPTQRQHAASILCIWATRGLLSGHDRPEIERARVQLEQQDESAPARQLVAETLRRIRT
jgi:hypothetical protein